MIPIACKIAIFSLYLFVYLFENILLVYSDALKQRMASVHLSG